MSQFEKLVRLREFELDERRRESGDILNEVNMLQDEMIRLKILDNEAKNLFKYGE